MSINLAQKQMRSFLDYGLSLKIKQSKAKGVKILCCLHITKETAVFVILLREFGFDVSLVTSNPLSTVVSVKDDLVKRGIMVYWQKNDNTKSLITLMKVAIKEIRPDYIVDDGGDLIKIIHKQGIGGVRGLCEQTTSWVTIDKMLEKTGKLKLPVVAVNNARTKNLVDNHYGTGQSIVMALMQATKEVLAGKRVVVCGYGHCGSGIAKRLRGLGAIVYVTEIDPVKSIQAFYEGFSVGELGAFCQEADYIITATGCINVVTDKHFKLLKNNCILVNAGHGNSEIDVEFLRKNFDHEEYSQFLERFTKNRKTVFLLAKGRIANLVISEGHPSEIMSFSYSSQLAGLHYLLNNKLENRVYALPPSYENDIAITHCRNLGIGVTKLTNEQSEYLA